MQSKKVVHNQCSLNTIMHTENGLDKRNDLRSETVPVPTMTSEQVTSLGSATSQSETIVNKWLRCSAPSQCLMSSIETIIQFKIFLRMFWNCAVPLEWLKLNYPGIAHLWFVFSELFSNLWVKVLCNVNKQHNRRRIGPFYSTNK